MKHATQLDSPQTRSLFGRLVEKFRATLNQLAPFGFEDADGFHYGMEDQPPVRHIVRFHHEPSAYHSRHYRTRHARPSFHSYRIVTRDFPAH